MVRREELVQFISDEAVTFGAASEVFIFVARITANGRITATQNATAHVSILCLRRLMERMGKSRKPSATFTPSRYEHEPYALQNSN